MIVSIHQPNFLPWYPFFEKVAQSDVFVIMSHCQFEKNNFQNRFNVDGKWYTMSVNSGNEPINCKQYMAPANDWRRICSTFPRLRQFDDCLHESLSEMNSAIIKMAARNLGISTKFEDDFATSKKGTERLVEICQRYGATTYLSGISGKKYLDVSKFEDVGIEVIFQDESKMNKQPLINFL